MKTTQFTDFIKQNTAPENAKRIVVYDSSGKQLGSFGLQNLRFPRLGNMLYKFGALSDIHISQDTAEEDFQRALTYLQETEQVNFNCICGDLTQHNEDAEFELYANHVSAYSANTPIYPIAGNHDCYGTGMTDARFEKYTGCKMFYTFEQGNDVFIMLSQLAWASQSSNVQPFITSQMQALYEALEKNRNKRCFVFMHPFPWGKAGDPFELYSSNSFFGTQGTMIYSLMKHYTNAIWFHGHSHNMFQMQKLHDKANYDFDFGCHNVHIPSLALPVSVATGERETMVGESQGYVVDVYKNHVVLRGRDFMNEKLLPIATYCLDTTLAEIEANTYKDETGTIRT